MTINTYQTAIIYSKWASNIPTFSILRPSKIYPNWDFWFENISFGNPALDTGMIPALFRHSVGIFLAVLAVCRLLDLNMLTNIFWMRSPSIATESKTKNFGTKFYPHLDNYPTKNLHFGYCGQLSHQK
jgi:hypothetical protein